MIPKALFTLIISFCFSLVSSAQLQQLLHKSYAEKYFYLEKLYDTHVAKMSLAEVANNATEMQNLGIKNKDVELELEGMLFYAIYCYQNNIGTPQEIIKRLVDVYNKAINADVLHIQLRATKILANYYWKNPKSPSNYEKAFELYMRLDQLLQKTDEKYLPDYLDYYNYIGKAYYYFKDYRRVIYYLKHADKSVLNKNNWKYYWGAYNTMGLCYQKLNLLDSADYYFYKAAKSPFFDQKDIRYSITMGNVGYNEYLRGNFAKAIPLITNDLQNAEKHNDYALAAGAAVPLADILIHEKKYEEARKLILKAREYISISRQEERLENLFKVITNWYLLQGLVNKAHQYQDSTINAINTNHNKFNALLLLRAQQKTDQQKIETQELAFSLKQKTNTLRLVILSIIIAVIIGGAVFIYYNQRKRHANQQKLKNAELKIAIQDLEKFAKAVAEKNEVIDKLTLLNKGGESTDLIKQLKEKALLTAEDWDEFEINFEKVHPQYIQRLKNKVVGITPAEVRVIVLSKLKLSHKEMANALGISAQTSRVNWHRLRKKLNLGDETSLEIFSDSI